MSSYRVLDGERGYRHVNHHDATGVQYSVQTWTALGFALIYGFHLVVKHFDLAVLSPVELLWNALIFVLPVQMIHLLGKFTGVDVDLRPGLSQAETRSEMRAVKSEGLRQVLRLGSGTSAMPIGLQNLKHLRTNSGIMKSDKPPGLGNWDNSCYQNSILQGLSSLPTFGTFLQKSMAILGDSATSTTGSLHTLTNDLAAMTNNGKRIWTPAKLKSMSSWQQQDAQEYYSRVLDDVEKDLKKVLDGKNTNDGLHAVGQIVREEQKAARASEQPPENPLEGLLGQRVGCAACGYSEGLSLLPFNCLTLSLGSGPRFSLENLLDDYTDLENIEGVECLSCTFKRQEKRLSTLLDSARPSDQGSEEQSPLSSTLPEAVQKQVAERLQAVRQVIEDSNYTDQALKRCAITKDAKISSTKTKQVVVARAPSSLAVHVNRSIFDEMTGALRKNLAYVGYPKYLSLKPWTLGQQRRFDDEVVETWPVLAGQSLVSQHRGLPPKASPDYVLRAVVTHYGRHENGHYICYRQHRASSDTDSDDVDSIKKAERWWRLSDDDVSEATEEEVLNQGGVFMLFYERLATCASPMTPSEAPRAVEDNITAEPVAEDIKETESLVNAIEPAGSNSGETAPEAVADVKTTDEVTTEDAAKDAAAEGGQPIPKGSRQEEPRQEPAAPTPRKLMTSRGKARKGSPMMSPGLPAVAAQ